MVFALADVGSFLALFCRAAALFVEFDDLREETTSDGRVYTSRTILPNCFPEPVAYPGAVKRSEVITDSVRLYEELGDIPASMGAEDFARSYHRKAAVNGFHQETRY
jgi:hypothetical protein